MSIWEKQPGPHPSCGGNYVMDIIETSSLDSTYLGMNTSQRQIPNTCAWAKAPCSFKFHNDAGVKEITADISMGNCSNTWTAPLWISPDNWTGGGSSGEIDVVEMCGGNVAQNYAGGTAWGGTQANWKSLQQSGFQKHRFHVKYSPVDNGSITTWACPLDDNGQEQSNCEGGGNYKNFSRTFGESGEARYSLVSDIWNGLNKSQACEGENPTSVCNYEVSNIKFHVAKDANLDEVFQGSKADLCKPLIVRDGPTPPPTPPTPHAPCDSYNKEGNKIVTLGYGDLPDASNYQASPDACCALCHNDPQCDAAVYWDQAPSQQNNCFLKGSEEPVMGKYLPLSNNVGFTTYCASDKCL